MEVDKTEAMLGSYGPQEIAYTKIVSEARSPANLSLRLKNPRPGCSPGLGRTLSSRES